MSDWYYEDDDGMLVGMTTEEWVRWQKERPGEREKYHRIAEDFVNGFRVSTVCLFVDHRFDGSDGPPLIYETMIFDHSNPKSAWSELYCDRYCTRAQALGGHARAIEKVKNGEIRPKLKGQEEEGAG